MAATVEINDAICCELHTQEVCEDCDYDGREENDAFYGISLANGTLTWVANVFKLALSASTGRSR
ncbi:hypothetical protein N7520_010419 [Penicillium odoratum]|uniref:uncharacterized protein n=1 Tax=Penicillium odoratum TaxID=1167516 RepID=UPI0025482A0C|nr:uncharacterized protein N7520_010419 [Penicillium odoratum]KAJ5745237.1 hypothetical protein N7520_010419 [Penicillium odoratum]